MPLYVFLVPKWCMSLRPARPSPLPAPSILSIVAIVLVYMPVGRSVARTHGVLLCCSSVVSLNMQAPRYDLKFPAHIQITAVTAGHDSLLIFGFRWPSMNAFTRHLPGGSRSGKAPKLRAQPTWGESATHKKWNKGKMSFLSCSL